MFESKFIKEHLERTFCYKCGSNLSEAKLVTITEAPIATIAHAVCPKCQAESMVTITANGSGVAPLYSDLSGEEFKKFVTAKNINYDDLLSLHKMLEKESIWKLLQKKEKSLVKKQSHLNTIEK